MFCYCYKWYYNIILILFCIKIFVNLKVIDFWKINFAFNYLTLNCLLVDTSFHLIDLVFQESCRNSNNFLYIPVFMTNLFLLSTGIAYSIHLLLFSLTLITTKFSDLKQHALINLQFLCIRNLDMVWLGSLLGTFLQGFLWSCHDHIGMGGLRSHMMH